MKEIEVAYELNEDIESAKNKLSKFTFVKDENILDTYFYDPEKKSSKPFRNNMGECLRLRAVNKEYTVSYKIDKYDEDGKWLNSDNYETKVQNIGETLNNFSKSNLKELVTLEKSRLTFKDGDYLLYLESIENLGSFFEIEFAGTINGDLKDIREEMKKYAKTLGLVIENPTTMGKPEMMIKKLGIKVQ